MAGEKTLYVQTSDLPERQYSPLVLAQAAVAMGLEPTLFYIGPGLRILVRGVADEIEVGSYAPLGEMLDRTRSLGVPIFACEASKQTFGWTSVDLIDGVTVAGAATLNDLAIESQATLCF